MYVHVPYSSFLYRIVHTFCMAQPDGGSGSIHAGVKVSRSIRDSSMRNCSGVAGWCFGLFGPVIH